MEPGDADAIAAALRETREETGIDDALSHPIGFLDSYETVSGFCITPVAAWIDVDYRTRPDPREVAEIFEVPLAFVLDPHNHQRQSRVDFGGVKREFWVLPYRDYYIWGATAGMLVNLYEVLRGD